MEPDDSRRSGSTDEGLDTQRAASKGERGSYRARRLPLLLTARTGRDAQQPSAPRYPRDLTQDGAASSALRGRGRGRGAGPARGTTGTEGPRLPVSASGSTPLPTRRRGGFYSGLKTPSWELASREGRVVPCSPAVWTPGSQSSCPAGRADPTARGAAQAPGAPAAHRPRPDTTDCCPCSPTAPANGEMPGRSPATPQHGASTHRRARSRCRKFGQGRPSRIRAGAPSGPTHLRACAPVPR